MFIVSFNFHFNVEMGFLLLDVQGYHHILTIIFILFLFCQLLSPRNIYPNKTPENVGPPPTYHPHPHDAMKAPRPHNKQRAALSSSQQPLKRSLIFAYHVQASPRYINFIPFAGEAGKMSLWTIFLEPCDDCLTAHSSCTAFILCLPLLSHNQLSAHLIK